MLYNNSGTDNGRASSVVRLRILSKKAAHAAHITLDGHKVSWDYPAEYFPA